MGAFRGFGFFISIVDVVCIEGAFGRGGFLLSVLTSGLYLYCDGVVCSRRLLGFFYGVFLGLVSVMGCIELGIFFFCFKGLNLGGVGGYMSVVIKELRLVLGRNFRGFFGEGDNRVVEV